MSNTTDDDLIAHLDERVEIECDGKLHAESADGHVAGQKATYAVRFGCPQCDNPETILICAGRLDWWRHQAATGARGECDNCGLINELADYIQTVLPLQPMTGKTSDTTPKKRRVRRQVISDLSPAQDCAPVADATPERSLTWEAAFAAFELYERAKNLSPRTIQNRAWVMNATAKALNKGPLDVMIEDLRSRLTRGVSASSMQSETSDYKVFFRFLAESGFRSDDLGKSLPTVRAPKRKPRPYTTAQIAALLSTGAYSHTRAMILLAFFQGFRASEVAAVHGQDLDIEANFIRVIGKGGKHSTLPLHPAVRKIAENMPTDDWWFPARNNAGGHIKSKSVSDLMTRAKLRAGITNERLTGHSLRHSFGTELVRAGVDLRTVQELMRHETLQTTELYTEINEDQMRDGLSRLTDLSKLQRPEIKN